MSNVNTGTGGQTQKIIFAVFSLPMFLMFAGLLWWSESRTVAIKQSLEEGESKFITVNSAAIEDANNGKLVHVSGMATSQETLTDPRFKTISATNSLKLERRVEMYQWKETKNDSGTEYDEVWSQKVIDSSKFRKAGHDNPGSMPVKGRVLYTSDPKLGAFEVTRSLINKIGNEQFITPDSTEGLEGSRIVGNQLYYGSNPSYTGGLFDSANIGDIRISFYAQMPEEITIIAEQSGNSLTPYTSSNGETIEMVSRGNVAAESMFESEHTLQFIQVWFVRLFIWLFLFGFFCLTFKRLSDFLAFIPLLRDLAKWGTVLFSLVMAFSISALVVSLTWISYRPVTSAPLLLFAIALVVLPRFTNKKSLSKNYDSSAPPVIGPASDPNLPPVLPVTTNETIDDPLPPVLPVTSNETTESTTAGELSHLNPQLLEVLEECTIYLASLDNKFTPIEQNCINSKFGAGAADRFTARITAVDEENSLKIIREKLCKLNPDDQSYMKTQAIALFQDLIQSDGLEDLEQDRLISLVRYIRESLDRFI